MFLLENPIQSYAWGSRTALARLRGAACPSPTPEAELWMGAHPSAPSHVVVDGTKRALDRCIADDPDFWLGPDRLPAYPRELPFLVKFLAAAAPLSLQTHPDAARAARGHALERASTRAPNEPRNYPDPHPKPELIFALEPFEALCGFRPMAELRTVFAGLGTPAVRPLVQALDASTSPAPAFAAWMHTPEEQRTAAVTEVLAACRRHQGAAEPLASACRLALRLAERYPADLGVVAAVMLRPFRLAPGQALFLGAGQLHSYLEGFGLEVMGNSDNVLRGGLTGKHIDIPELLRVLDFDAPPVEVLAPVQCGPGHERFVVPAQEFALEVLELDDDTPIECTSRGPEIVVCRDGFVTASAASHHVALHVGQSAIAPAATGRYTLRGSGRVFRITQGDLVDA